MPDLLLNSDHLAFKLTDLANKMATYADTEPKVLDN
jgi:hypothetical protein